MCSDLNAKLALLFNVLRKIVLDQFLTVIFLIINFSRRSAMYQSTGSLHSDGHSSNSMSPAPSPSPTHHRVGAAAAGAPQTPGGPPMTPNAVTPSAGQPRPLSNSMSNLALSGSKKRGSSSDLTGSFRDQSPAPNGSIAR